MRKLLIICSVILQVFVLAFIGGQREYVLHTGKIIYLRTAPVDPRDFFRGDYVNLNYEISNINETYFRDGLKVQTKKDNEYSSYRENRGKQVYTVLKIDDNNMADIDYVTDKKPSKGLLYIRGRQGYSYDSSINVSYGIEAFFVEQGKGRQLENRMMDEESFTLDMKIAVGDNGIAVIKGYRRSPLIIKAENFERKDGVLQRCKLVLTNISDKPVAVVDLPGYSSLRLDLDDFFHSRKNKKISWTKQKSTAVVEDKDVHVLQPNQNYKFNIDFNDAYWSVVETEKGTKTLPVEKFTELDDIRSFFSLVYESPSSEQCKNLKDAKLIWHGRMSSGRLSRYENNTVLPSFFRGR